MQHLPQRCLEQSGPRVTDRECPPLSVFTDHRANTPAIPGHFQQAGSLKALRNRAKEKGDWLLTQNLSPSTHSCSHADRMGTEGILSTHKQPDSTLQLPNGPLIYATLRSVGWAGRWRLLYSNTGGSQRALSLSLSQMGCSSALLGNGL